MLPNSDQDGAHAAVHILVREAEQINLALLEYRVLFTVPLDDFLALMDTTVQFDGDTGRRAPEIHYKPHHNRLPLEAVADLLMPETAPENALRPGHLLQKPLGQRLFLPILQNWNTS